MKPCAKWQFFYAKKLHLHQPFSSIRNKIQKNSSWEERFIHRSSPENKRSFFAILVGMVFLSYLLAKLFQYYKEMV